MVAVAYVVLMVPKVRSMVAAAYVRDIDASRAFYELLGFGEHSGGKAETSAWSVMQHDGVSVLLASASPSLGIPPQPDRQAPLSRPTGSPGGVAAVSCLCQAGFPVPWS